MRAKRVMSANLTRTKTQGNRYQLDELDPAYNVARSEADMNRFRVLTVLFLLSSASFGQTTDTVRTTPLVSAAAQWSLEMDACPTGQETVTIDGLTSSLGPIRVNFMSTVHKNPLGRGSGLYPSDAPRNCGVRWHHSASGWRGTLTCSCQVCSIPVDLPPAGP